MQTPAEKYLINKCVNLLKEPSQQWKKAAITWGTRQRVSIQTERYRLNTDIDFDPNYFELYDHEYDPKEHVNLSCNPQYGKIIDLLLSYYKNHKEENFLLGY